MGVGRAPCPGRGDDEWHVGAAGLLVSALSVKCGWTPVPVVLFPGGGKHALLGELVGRPAYKAAEFPDPPPRAVDG